MKILVSYLLYLLITQASYADTQNNTDIDWRGRYNYVGYGGREVGGIAVFIDIALSISSSGECKITRQGYQVMDSMDCSVIRNKKGIHVIFKSYPNSKSVNQYGVAEFKPGDILFSLTASKPHTKIITDWGRLMPVGYVKNKSGVYFIRNK